MKRTITFIIALCCVLGGFAQQFDNYIYKLDSVCYGTDAKEVLTYDKELNCIEIKTVISYPNNTVLAAKNFIYDNDNRVVKTDYFWDLGNYRDIHEFTYNENNLLVEDYLEQYNTSILFSKFKYIYEYDNESHIIVTKGYYEDDDETWKLRYRINFEYEDGLLKSSFKYLNDGYGDPVEVINYTYNDQGLCLEIFKHLNYNSDSAKTIFTYNESGLRTSKTIFKKDEDQPWNDELIMVSKKDYLYDENGNCITSDEENYAAGWHTQYNLSYDLSVPYNTIAGIMDFWDYAFSNGSIDFIPNNMVLDYYRIDVGWDTAGPITFHYSNGTTIDETESEPVTIWPNPTSEILHIETKGLVKIVSMDGRLVLTSETAKPINVSSLAQGCYLLMITTSDGRQTVHKFVKK